MTFAYYVTRATILRQKRTDRQTHRQTDRQTKAGQNDPYSTAMLRRRHKTDKVGMSERGRAGMLERGKNLERGRAGI